MVNVTIFSPRKCPQHLIRAVKQFARSATPALYARAVPLSQWWAVLSSVRPSAPFKERCHHVYQGGNYPTWPDLLTLNMTYVGHLIWDTDGD